MTIPPPLVAGIYYFSYLWKREDDAGLKEGQKDRPCVVFAIVKDGDTIGKVFLSPITHTVPSQLELAAELPASLKPALGLDDAPAWIMADEVNETDWPGYDLRPAPGNPRKYLIGILPPGLFGDLKKKILVAMKSGTLATTSR